MMILFDIDNTLNSLEKVKRIVRDILGDYRTEMTPETRLIEDLGCDSLDCIEIVMACEDEFDAQINDDDAEKCRTIADILALLEKTISPSNEKPTTVPKDL